MLGADIYDHIVLETKIQQDSVFIRETIFGWIISGCIDDPNAPTKVRSFHVITDNFDLSKFWEVEDVPRASKITAEESLCEKHFTETTKRQKGGRFEVALPFRENNPPDLDFTLSMASRRFMLLEKRLSKGDRLRKDYSDFVKEFIDLGHLEKVPETELIKLPGQTAYLPRHAVFKESSTTTKTRVVFDGSAQKENVSLNNSLLVGPKIQDDLFEILLRFGRHKVAISLFCTPQQC